VACATSNLVETLDIGRSFMDDLTRDAVLYRLATASMGLAYYGVTVQCGVPVSQHLRRMIAGPDLAPISLQRP
jgi:hypothetical protein